VNGGEIMGLLGHNGAGKSTLIGMLTGLHQPSEGDATIMGCSILDDMEGVRRHMSVCPQYSPSLKKMTCRQQLVLLSHCRGVDLAEVEPQIDAYMTALGIHDKLDEESSSLSGGQLRRLWIATALLGTTEVVLLDEPTSGMDPESRRDFWVLLKKVVREDGRAVVFTTHYLEEADVLADRKCILAAGKKMAEGTSVELKKQYGPGYWVNIALNTDTLAPAGTPAATRASQLQQKFGEIKQVFASGLKLPVNSVQTKNTSMVDSNNSFLVPWEQVENLCDIVDTLEGRASQLHILNSSVEMTSLEEVFMRIGHLAEQPDGEEAGENAASENGVEAGNAGGDLPIGEETGKPLFLERECGLRQRSFNFPSHVWSAFTLRWNLIKNGGIMVTAILVFYRLLDSVLILILNLFMVSAILVFY
jgi:ABC-type multidrug transport system ATPase subunit